MPSSSKHTNSKLYAFLESSGVLSNGTPEDIAIQKKIFWNEYKRKHKQQKRHEHKVFEIWVSKDEQRVLSKAAAQKGISITKYIKLAALAADKAFVTPETKGEIRQKLFSYFESLCNRIEETVDHEESREEFLTHINTIESELLGFILNKIGGMT